MATKEQTKIAIKKLILFKLESFEREMNAFFLFVEAAMNEATAASLSLFDTIMDSR